MKNVIYLHHYNIKIISLWNQKSLQKKWMVQMALFI